jgi:hypothetical protein
MRLVFTSSHSSRSHLLETQSRKYRTLSISVKRATKRSKKDGAASIVLPFKEERASISSGETHRAVLNDNGDNLYVAAPPVNKLGNQLRPLFIRYVERKLIWEYALEWGVAPKCNRK